MRQPLRDIAAAQHGAFTTRQAMSCYSRGELRALLRSGRWAGVFSGTSRVEAGEPSARLRLSAAGLSLGREVPAFLHTAAELHGFGVLADAVTHVAVSPDEPCARRPHLWPHQLVLGPRAGWQADPSGPAAARFPGGDQGEMVAVRSSSAAISP